MAPLLPNNPLLNVGDQELQLQPGAPAPQAGGYRRRSAGRRRTGKRRTGRRRTGRRRTGRRMNY